MDSELSQPTDSKALENLARQRFSNGDVGGAIDLLRRAIAIDPYSPHLHANLGVALAAVGRLDEAIPVLQQALSLNPGSPQIEANLAKAYIDQGNTLLSDRRYGEAVPCYQNALKLQPDHRWMLNNLAIALQETGRPQEALMVCLRAVEVHPDFVEAWYNLGRIHQDLDRQTEAAAAFERALLLRPDYAAARSNMAMTLQARGRFDEAVVEYRRAIESDPEYDDPQINIGIALRDAGRTDEAIAHYRNLLSVRPDLAEARWNLGITLLRQGQLEEGFAAAEARRRIPRLKCDRTFNRPQWQGEDLSRRTILLHYEQGFGDVIQFVRYASLVHDRGGRVIVLCQPELKRLFENQLQIEKVIAEGESLPAYDVHCPLLTLPLIFRTTLESIPNNVPYIKPDPSLASKWADRLSPLRPARTIGIAWAGNPRHANDDQRSIPPELLGPLAQVPGVRWVSLQKPRPAKLPNLNLLDLTDEFSDFADTAALVFNLDLVISADSAVAHLAGALGKPVLTLLPYVPDWRWMLDRTDSAWYPTMRLFRQPKFGDWLDVVSFLAGVTLVPRRADLE
jgi:tetratricopeptide (TPR) repeat protein